MKNLRTNITIVFCSCFFFAQAGKGTKYAVNEIPEDLKKNVNMVVREDVMVYTILSRSEATLHALAVMTIMNEKADHFAELTLGYDKLRKIKKMGVNVFDAAGKLIRKIKNSEIRDQSSFDGFSLFSDNRLKWINVAQNTYPYTVEFEYEIEYQFLYAINGSEILDGENTAVQHASYELIYPPDLRPHYKTPNIDSKPAITKTSDNKESVKWTFENLMPIHFEPFGPHRELIPRIIAAPNEFEYAGYVGNMSTWADYGRWQLLLNKGRDELPEETKQKVRELTKGLSTPEQKARALYEYLQNKTRYVSIQLGIGGLQPFEATVVDKTGYGDCKALSNYMVALLKEAGVRGYYTTVMAGRGMPNVLTDFPSHQANHVIVSIPNGADTLWLECTSQTNPFGYQGTFTGDRKALMITENGGVLVNTRRYTAEQNKETRSADVFVDKNGNAKASVKTTYAGLQYENGGLNFAIAAQHDDQKKWLQKNTDIPSFDIGSFSMINHKDIIPSAVVSVELVLNHFASVSGKRLFLTANLQNRSKTNLEKTEKRKSDVYFPVSYTDLDTIRYHIPEELYPEFLPEPIKLNSPFGVYQASFKLDQGKVVYIRKMVMNKGVYPPESYKDLVEFYKNVNKADNIKLVFLNKT